MQSSDRQTDRDSDVAADADAAPTATINFDVIFGVDFWRRRRKLWDGGMNGTQIVRQEQQNNQRQLSKVPSPIGSPELKQRLMVTAENQALLMLRNPSRFAKLRELQFTSGSKYFQENVMKVKLCDLAMPNT